MKITAGRTHIIPRDKPYAVNIRIPYKSRTYAQTVLEVLSLEISKDVESNVSHEFVLNHDALMVYVRSNKYKDLQPAAESFFKGFYFLNALITEFAEDGKKHSWIDDKK